MRVNTVIVLSLICLIAVIVLQGVWLKQAANNNKSRFDYAVNEALNDAVAKREKDIVFKMMTGGFFNDSFTKKLEVYINTDDSGTIGLKEENSSIYIDTTETETKKSITRDTRIMTFTGDSLAGDRWKGRMDSIMLDIIANINTDSIKQYSETSYVGMDDIIRTSLKQKNLDNDFEFSIKGVGGRTIYKSEGYIPTSFPNEYSVSLNPSSVGISVVKLVVQIKNKGEYILKSLLPFALAMLVFTIIISVTFIISIRTILKQKKISSIKNDFINNMTHEFKTPIATISLASDALKNEKPTQEQINHFADIIKQESKSMNQKVETILQMSLVEQQKIKLSKENIDINNWVEGVLNNLQLKIENSNTEVSLELLDKKSILYADTHHMGNVLSNIIDNSIKYSAGVPQIKITVKELGEQIVITFRDKGIGMSPEEQKRVFDKFYRAQTGNIHNTKGFGLGLSYAKQIVELHQGQIDVESQKGEGTTVTLTLQKSNGTKD